MEYTLKQCKCTIKQIEICERYNCKTAVDVLQLYPFRYEELVYKPYNEWREKDKVIFEGIITTYPKTVRFAKKRSMTKFQIEAEDSYLNAVLFNHPWVNSLKVGSKFTFIARYEGNNQVSIIQYNQSSMELLLGIKPVYPLKENIQQRTIKSIIKKVFTHCYTNIENFVPSDYILKYKLLNKNVALQYVHFPKSTKEIEMAYRTLKYEEFLKFHLAINLLRTDQQESIKNTRKKFDSHIIYNMIDELPFECTPDQINTIEDILNDMKSEKVMYRLVQGDVGCGKTVVAWFSMMACVLSNKQAALMAPTEILAKQHYESFLEYSKNTTIKIEVLYSSLPLAKKKEILSRLKNKEIDICIGTHSLIQDGVEFNDLGLVIADEQHRFGVEQRRKLKEKGEKVDFILMSATPIPRTLANTLYGDMDVSSIITMPKNRKPVTTKVVNTNTIDVLKDQIESHLIKNEQIYVVCAAIEESEKVNVHSIDDVAVSLKKILNKNVNIGLLHGKMSSENKEEVMKKFANNEFQILISTTVVEVGVNVVNATMMIIMDAHRFGLSSLHQLRGRVQRGYKSGLCFLLTDTKDENSLKRLDILEKCSDGFKISYEDLKLRGPGDILGIRQSGLPGFILGNIFEDTRIIETAKNDALVIFQNQNHDEYKKCIQKVIELNKKTYQIID